MHLYGFTACFCSDPGEVVGSISYINSYLSEEGLHRRTTLPPVIFDLYSPPPTRARHLAEEQRREAWGQEEELGDMAHRRGRIIRKKPKPPPPSRIEKVAEQPKIPLIVSEVS